MSKELLPAQLAQGDPMKTNSDGSSGPAWLLGREHRGVQGWSPGLPSGDELRSLFLHLVFLLH